MSGGKLKVFSNKLIKLRIKRIFNFFLLLSNNNKSKL